ncbi:hypothetical protein FQA39_LY03488 [Lamprigera yunnana]|nr:hypothetical protein FQA39_LY03488 [Lamprigera yunnana]
MAEKSKVELPTNVKEDTDNREDKDTKVSEENGVTDNKTKKSEVSTKNDTKPTAVKNDTKPTAVKNDTKPTAVKNDPKPTTVKNDPKPTTVKNKDSESTADSENMIQLTLEEGENLQDEEMEQDVATDAKNEEDTSSKDQSVVKQQDDANKVPDEKKEENAPHPENKNNPSTTEKAKKKNSQNRNLWITNIAQTTKATELKEALSAYGKVIGAKVVINAKEPGACCYGYVTMDTVEDADKCIANLNNTELNGCTICIEKVRPDHMNSKLRSSGQPKHHQSKKPDRKEEPSKQPAKEDEKTEVPKSPEKSGSKTQSRGRSPDRSQRSTTSKGKKRDTPILTYKQIKEEQERQRHRKRMIQEENRRRREEDSRRREIERMQRSEGERLAREREKLRLEREKIAREKAEIIRLQCERQKLEREKLELEKLELQRDRVRLQEAERRSIKRASSFRRSEYEDKKRISSDRRYDDNMPQMHFEPVRMSRDGESHYNEQERERGSHYAPLCEDRDPRSEHKTNFRSSRDHRYVVQSGDSQHFERSTGSNNWNHSSGGPQNKVSNIGIAGNSATLASKTWAKEDWRPAESSNPHRWNSGSLSRTAPQQLPNTGFQGNSNMNLSSSGSRAPEANTYSGNKFEYKSMTNIRKY